MAQNFSAFETYMTNATSPGPNRTLAGVACMAVDKNGKLLYNKSFGTRSIDPTSELANVPFDSKTTGWFASCTKLMTAVSVMQCVEKNLITLDDDVLDLLPELKDIQILEGFSEDGSPLLKKREGKITLRLLLTHSSGVGYSLMDPKLVQFIMREGVSFDPVIYHRRPLLDIYGTPLVYEPGAGWEYGGGVDLAGLAISRLTKLSLESYMETNIWKPLSMNRTTFRASGNAEILSSRSEMVARLPTGELITSPTRLYPDDAPDDCGGNGTYSCADDYIKLLASLLSLSSPLLSQSSIRTLFAPSAPENGKYVKHALYRKGEVSPYDPEPIEGENSFANRVFSARLPKTADVNFTLGGLTNLADVEGRRRKGSVMWSGMPNIWWMLDGETGVAILYASQMLAVADMPSIHAFTRFEEAVYAAL